MKVKINAWELNRMMKIITQCTDAKDQKNKANVEIGFMMDKLYIHASDGHFTATMTTPFISGENEKFCVDGSMFAKVCAMCSGDIEITTDGKTCTVKGAGRTRIPIVDAKIPRHDDVIGKSCTVMSEDLCRCFSSVAYAVSPENTRIQLTGVLTEVEDSIMKMTALDGFQLSIESVGCSGTGMKMIVPAPFLKLLSQAVVDGEKVEICTDGKRIAARTDCVQLSCGLLAGEFPDVNRILPNDFKTECLVNVDEMRTALKSGSVVNSKQNLVKMEIGADSIRIMNNSEEAEFDADVKCDTHGDGLKIAFNNKYLISTMNAVGTENAIMHFNTSVSPCIVRGQNTDGIRLLLPVRVAG